MTDREMLNKIYEEMDIGYCDPIRAYGPYLRVLEMVKEYLEVDDDKERD